MKKNISYYAELFPQSINIRWVCPVLFAIVTVMSLRKDSVL